MDYKKIIKMEPSDLMKQITDKIHEVNKYKREFISHGEISKTSNQIIKDMRECVVSTIETEYECEYNRSDTYLKDVLIEILPGKIDDIIYERTRDMIIKDKSKIDKYDKLQDHIGSLDRQLSLKMYHDEMKKDKKESEVQ